MNATTQEAKHNVSLDKIKQGHVVVPGRKRTKFTPPPRPHRGLAATHLKSMSIHGKDPNFIPFLQISQSLHDPNVTLTPGGWIGRQSKQTHASSATLLLLCRKHCKNPFQQQSIPPSLSTKLYMAGAALASRSRSTKAFFKRIDDRFTQILPSPPSTLSTKPLV
jgi:hypothetical protein